MNTNHQQRQAFVSCRKTTGTYSDFEGKEVNNCSRLESCTLH